MSEEKKCRDCKFYGEYICMISMWEDGKLRRGQLVREEQAACSLFEEKAGEEIHE